jgi:dTDP-4-amino-4,6-dideoxygalactose transaminase
MPKNRIYLCLAHMSEAGLEQKYIQEAFDTNWVVPLGPNVNGFEADLEAYVIGRKAVALSSCTAALHLALLHLGVGAGDEVLCQTFSFCASTNPVTYCGAKPVFVDSDPDTWNLDPILLEQAINDRIAKTGKKPKAIIVVDLYGMPAQWDALERLGKKYGIPIIEDAANAMGSLYDGHLCGTFGSLATLSFNGNKMITTSGGGALLCNDEETKKRTIFLSTQAREEAPYYQHETIGFNYRLSNICAGIGRGQMTVLGEHVQHHKHVHDLYKELLGPIKGIEVHDNPSDKFDSNFWLTTITINPSIKIKGQENQRPIFSDCEPNANVEALRVVLDQAGVEARPLWKPMHKQPVYAKIESLEFRVESLPHGIVCQTSDKSIAYINGVSEGLFKVGMCLPSGPYVTDEDVRYIVNCIKEAIE